MIGLNTAILSESGASAGIGFAIPVDTVNRIAAELIRTGAAPEPGIGITTASPALSAELGVNGVIVQRAIPGWPAAQAGLHGVNLRTGKIGDIITAVNGQPVQTAADLSALLAAIGIGHTAELKVEDRGQTRTVPVKIVDISTGPAPS
jgi:2-alkenal reductase